MTSGIFGGEADVLSPPFGGLGIRDSGNPALASLRTGLYAVAPFGGLGAGGFVVSLLRCARREFERRRFCTATPFGGAGARRFRVSSPWGYR